MDIKSTPHKNYFINLTALLMVLFILQGCVVFLASVATVVQMKSSNHFTATVLIEKEPSEVYAAMLQIIERKNDVEIVLKEDQKYLLEATRGERHITARASAYASGKTQLMVTSDTGESGQGNEDLAFNVVKNICEELGVKYRLAEE